MILGKTRCLLKLFRLKRSLAFTLTILLLLPGTVYAREKPIDIVVKSDVVVKQIGSKATLKIPKGTCIEEYKLLDKNSVSFIKDGKTYTMPRNILISLTQYNQMLEPKKEYKTELINVTVDRDLSKANAYLSGRLKTTDTEDPLATLYMLSDGGTEGGTKYLRKYIDSFQPKGKTNNEKIKSVHSYLLDLGLQYDTSGIKYTQYPQFQSLPSGITQCHGITVLGAKMLDKAGVPYRCVTSFLIGGAMGHIYLEVKNDQGIWSKFDLTDIVLFYKSSERDLARKRLDSILKNPKQIEEDVGLESNTRYSVSPEILKGKVVGGELKSFTKVTVENVIH